MQELVAAVMEHYRLRDNRAQRGHARRQPRRHAATMKRTDCRAGRFAIESKP
jgi:hypothetical protein